MDKAQHSMLIVEARSIAGIETRDHKCQYIETVRIVSLPNCLLIWAAL